MYSSISMYSVNKSANLLLFVVIIIAEENCITGDFTIISGGYGHVHLYGIYENLHLLEFSKTQPPAYFCFTNTLALKELEAGKCVGIISKTNLQLVLTNNCKRPWRYNQDNKGLIDIKAGYCFSPWSYLKQPPPQVQFVSGLSRCAEWNRVVLNPMPKQKTTKSIITKPFTRSVMYPTKEPVSLAITTRHLEENMNTTKGQSPDKNSNTMSISTALYIFLPTVLAILALIIVIIFLVRRNRAVDKKSSEEENNGDTEDQHNNDQSITENDVYTELDQNREPDNTYASLVHYENPDAGREPVFTEPQLSSTTGNNHDYENPGP